MRSRASEPALLLAVLRLLLAVLGWLLLLAVADPFDQCGEFLVGQCTEVGVDRQCERFDVGLGVGRRCARWPPLARDSPSVLAAVVRPC